MASFGRPPGSGKEYRQAKITVGKSLDVEKLVTDNVIDAVKKMAEILNHGKAPIAIQLSAAKFFIEAHAKIAKAHGKNPKPVDFIVDDTTTESPTESKIEDKVVELKFREG